MIEIAVTLNLEDTNVDPWVLAGDVARHLHRDRIITTDREGDRVAVLIVGAVADVMRAA